MDARAFTTPKGLRPRRRLKPAHDQETMLPQFPVFQFLGDSLQKQHPVLLATSERIGPPETGAPELRPGYRMAQECRGVLMGFHNRSRGSLRECLIPKVLDQLHDGLCQGGQHCFRIVGVVGWNTWL